MWGNLERGAHAVGFRQLLLRDPSRPTLPLEEGQPAPDDGGRQMQIVFWYPAVSATGSALTYGDYVARTAQELDFSPLDASRVRAANERLVKRAADFRGDTLALRATLPRLLRMSVLGRLNARAARGKFPLVIFPEGQTPALNQILGEYLASHGYVVASTSTKGSFDTQIEYWSPRGMEAMAADLRFVIAALDTIVFVDTRRIGVMGVGINASGALALQMRTPAVRALVSLEGGITTQGEMDLIGRTPYFDIGAIRVPILAITAPHPSVDAARLDLYRYSTRHLVHFPTMGEFWFLDYGMLERYVPGIIGAAPGDTNAGYEWGARFTRRFFDGYLRGDAAALQWIERDAAALNAPAGLFTVTTKRGLPAPPTITALKALISSGGAAAVVRLVDERAARDSQPIAQDYFVELNSWLAVGRDSSGRERHELARLRVRLHPRSARAHYSLGQSANRQNDRALARTHLNEALKLLPTDTDPSLVPTLRQAIERAATEALAALGTQ